MRLAAPCAEAWSFAQLDDFWDRYSPLTPWGKDEREARVVYADAELLEGRYDDIEAVLGLMREDKAAPESLDSLARDRVSYHLRRMPRLTLEPRALYEVLELFQIKKFIANYKGAVSALGEGLSAAFGMSPLERGSAASSLASELDRGGSDPETFYVADCYDPGLADARAGIAAADAIVAEERVRAEAEARLAFGVSFDGREFIVAPKDAARAMLSGEGPDGRMGGAAGRYAAEPYDDARYLVRLLPSPRAVEAMAERERYLADERRAEERVVARLSALAAAAMPALASAVAATTRLDRARAGAELALAFGMSRPRLSSCATRLVDARFVPCADECRGMGLEYSPLSAEFDSGAVVLFGSNMGGKTVVLKTLLFFQLLAQAGLFVPARTFETSVYDRVEYVGELSGERLAGLSGFGLEVWRLMAAGAGGAGPGGPGDQGDRGDRGDRRVLVAFDELARTTGSHEAEALLSAVVESYARAYEAVAGGAGGDRAFFATHFRGVARIEGAEYRRMRGLDRAAAAAALERTGGAGPVAGAELSERLAGINRHMRYEVVDDDGSGSESDALAIASLLGLDPRIVERARYYLTKDGV
ncbi:MAG: hypothetical protein KKA67_01250 [Spirochaetes bacterium]|nr:hypothetical protein [Spirochaetota bacterium]MBU1079171.1 hypothetical protein [Spirochaetota bacterium]